MDTMKATATSTMLRNRDSKQQSQLLQHQGGLGGGSVTVASAVPAWNSTAECRRNNNYSHTKGRPLSYIVTPQSPPSNSKYYCWNSNNTTTNSRPPMVKSSRCLQLILLLHVFAGFMAAVAGGQQFDLKEYCEAENFNPTCQPDEVVVVRSARYGRMRIGKCVRTDYGYVGCFSDVLPHLDSKCSGRRSCDMRIPDQELDDNKPCPTEFKTYLEASYSCVRVESSECNMCQTSTHAAITLDKGYLASIVTQESDMKCGSARCPWRIELAPGQKINITMFDFGVASTKRLQGFLDSCLRYAIIKEKGQRDTPICSSSKRESHLYLSKSNVIEIHVISPEVFAARGQFMLYYEAVGCPKLESPKNSWAKQEGKVFTYGCLGSGETWSMTCKGTTWEGTMQGCPMVDESRDPPVLTLSLGVLIAIIVAIALVIGVFILTVGLVCLKRQQYANIRRQGDASVYLRTRRESDYPEDMATATMPLRYAKKDERVRGDQSEDAYKARPPHPHENVYMESRPLPQIPQSDSGAAANEAEDDRSDKGGKVQVYRTSSGREHYHNPRLVITPRPTPPGSAEPREDPQYFVLDPEEVDSSSVMAGTSSAGYPYNNSSTSPIESQYHHHLHRQPPPAPAPPLPPADFPSTTGVGPGTKTSTFGKTSCSSAMPPPPLRRIARGGVQSDKQKSPEEENAENFCKEVSNTSCQDLPALQQHYETSVDCHSHNNGTSSWP